jgi:hypothetical protein
MPPGERRSSNFTSHVGDVLEQLSLLGLTIVGGLAVFQFGVTFCIDMGQI